MGRRASDRAISACVIAALMGAPAYAQGAISPMKSMASWRAVDDWVREWDIPAEPATVDPPNAEGACVTLRLGGQVVGRGQAMSAKGDAVWRAAKEAMAEARLRMPFDRDALRDEAMLEYAKRITIDLQVIEDLIPLPEESLTSISSRLSPGLDGVAVRIGDRIEAVYPATMLSMNVSPGQAIVGALTEFELPSLGIGDPRQSLSKLRKEHDLVVYRFRCHHVVQVDEGDSPKFLFRGGRVRLISEVSAKSLRRTGALIRRHLRSRLFPGQVSLGLMSDYRPWSDEYAPPVVADARSQGLAAFALARWGVLQSDESAVRLAVEVLEELMVLEDGEVAVTEDAVASAFCAMAVIALGAEASDELQTFAFVECAGSVSGAFDADAGYSAELSGAERAVVACAMAEMARALVDGAARDEAQAAVRTVFREAPPNQLAAVMPWIGWAELALVEDGAQIPSAVALRGFRKIVWDHQLSNADAADMEPDLVGGVLFTASRAPLPSWQTFRPVAFCATMLGEPRLTEADERAPEAAHLIAALRFLMQLQVAEDEMHMFQDEERSLGGIRLAPWDQTLTIEASAIALLTLTEALESMSAGRRASE